MTSGGIIATNFLAKSGFAQAPGIITSDKERPSIPYGVASGDIDGNRAVIWSRSDRPAQMIVEYSLDESFRKVQRVKGANALNISDYTARVDLKNLPDLRANRPPSEGFQFFGTVKIDSNTEVMTVALINLEGKTLYSVDLPPEK